MTHSAVLFKYSQQAVRRTSEWLIAYWLPLGWLALLSGMFWIGSRPHYHKLFYAMLAAPTLITLLLQPGLLKPLLRQPLIRLFLLFASYILLSILWADTDETLLSSAKRPLYILMLFAAAALINLRTPGKLESMTLLAACTAVICAALSLLYHYYTGAAERFSGYGALYNPLLSAHVFGFFCVYWLTRWYLSKNAMALPLLAALAILWTALIFTGSRTPLVALSACFIWLAVAHWKPRLWLIIATAISLAIAIQALNPASDLMARGMSYRPAIWQEVLRQIETSPWFGLGYTHPQIFRVPGLDYALADTHNIELGILFCGGVVGLSLWLMIYAYAMLYAWQRRQDPAVLVASTLVVFGFVAGLTEGSSFFSRPKEHWFLIWIPLALLTATRLRPQPPVEDRHGTTEKA